MVDVLIQTHNEELNLPWTLASVRDLAHRIFIVDSGSTDQTIAKAEAAGATVVHHLWEGYAAQKNWAIDNLPWESPWLLILDADEALTPELAEEIRHVTSRPVNTVKESAFYVNRVFIFLGRKIRHCGYFPSWNLRLFKRGHARYEQREVHEHMIVTGKTAYLKNLILHEDRRGLEHYIAKHNRYSTLEARELYLQREQWPGIGRFFTDRLARRRWMKYRLAPKIALPWLWRFIYMYLLQGGFLDRRPGLTLCFFISSYEFFIRTKYAELIRLKGRYPANIAGLASPEGSTLSMPSFSIPPLAVAPARPNSAGELLPSGPTAHARSERADRMTGSSTAAPDRPDIASVSAPITVAVSRPLASGAPVSVMIPTLNEEGNLARCLDHLKWAGEVVVVDSGSKDRTCAIAEAYGASVVTFHWNGQWPKKKNWALRNVAFKFDWVLIVDADEWITPELADEITAAVEAERNGRSQYSGYYINRRFIFMGGWIRHCGYYPSWNLRLIKRGHGEYERLTNVGNTGSGDNEVHEHIAATGPIGHFRSDMLHFAFPSIHVFMEKHNRYSNWEAAVQYAGSHGDTAAVPGSEDLSRRRKLKKLSRYLPFRPTLRFLYSFIWKGGFLDGRPGFVFCRLLSIYEFLSVTKYQEMCRADEDKARERDLSAVPPATAASNSDGGNAS